MSGGRSVAAGEDVEELYDDAPVGYLTTTMDGTIVRANGTFVALSGHTAHDLSGRRFYDLLPPGAKIYYETHYAPLLEMQQEVREIALEVIRADGSRIPVLVNAKVTRAGGSDRPLVRVTVFDATQRRQYERELLHARMEAESRAAAASALHHVAEAVLLLDDDGNVVVINPAAARLFALGEAEAVGSTLATHVPGWAAIVDRIPIGAGEVAPAAMVLPLAAGGDTRWVAASAERAAMGTVFTLRDITADRALQGLRDDIVAVVSHELRTPLAGVYGAAQTLASRGDELSAPQRQTLVEMLVEQSGKLTRILDEILLTQRLDNDDIEVSRTHFAVGQVVARVVGRSPSWRGARHVRLDETADLQAVGDPGLFEQVLVNLLDNAVKYSPEGSTVEVAVRPHRGSVRVTVADEGPGVPEALAERVFEKFFRVDPAQLSGVTGTGLGLYISRELVSRMDGRIGLLEGASGATFFVDLPRAT